MSSAPARYGFLNISNHPSAGWPDAQREAARAAYGEVTDLEGGFPHVSPRSSPDELRALARDIAGRVDARTPPPAAIFVAGEHRLTYALVRELQAARHPCVCSTTERDATEALAEDGKTVIKQGIFRFAGWAEYP